MNERLGLLDWTNDSGEGDADVNLSLSEVVSLLGLADDDQVLAGTSEENRKRALWQFYSTGMLTHSHSDGEFPIYSQGESPDEFT